MTQATETQAPNLDDTFQIDEHKGMFYIFVVGEQMYHRFKFKSRELATRYMKSFAPSWTTSRSTMEYERRRLVRSKEQCTLAQSR